MMTVQIRRQKPATLKIHPDKPGKHVPVREEEAGKGNKFMPAVPTTVPALRIFKHSLLKK